MGKQSPSAQLLSTLKPVSINMSKYEAQKSKLFGFSGFLGIESAAINPTLREWLACL